MTISIKNLKASSNFSKVVAILKNVAKGEHYGFISAGYSEPIYKDSTERNTAALVGRGTYYTLVGNVKGVWDTEFSEDGTPNNNEYRERRTYREEWVPAIEFMALCAPLIEGVTVKEGASLMAHLVLTKEEKAVWENTAEDKVFKFNIPAVQELLRQLEILGDSSLPKNPKQAAALGLNPEYFL